MHPTRRGSLTRRLIHAHRLCGPPCAQTRNSTFLLCAYILSYEGYFVISGTITNDSKADEREMQSNPSYIFFTKNNDKTSKAYDRLRKRYDDPEDKMYENSWFKENTCNPHGKNTRRRRGNFKKIAAPK